MDLPPMLSAVELDELRRFDTPTVCNAIELFETRPRTAGYTNDRIRACFPDLPPMVGYACTATFRSAAPPSSADHSDASQRLIESISQCPTPVVVVFQDLDDPPAAATFGDGMCLTYKTFGAVGLVTSGAARDLDNVRQLDFPCFASGTICAHGYCHINSTGSPVRVGGLTVHPGDLLHGDRNGITSIPREIAPTVAQVCAEFLAAEALVLDPLRHGESNPQEHQKRVGEMHRQLDAIRARLRGQNARP